MGRAIARVSKLDCSTLSVIRQTRTTNTPAPAPATDGSSSSNGTLPM